MKKKTLFIIVWELKNVLLKLKIQKYNIFNNLLGVTNEIFKVLRPITKFIQNLGTKIIFEPKKI